MKEQERDALMRELVTEAGMNQPELWHKAPEQAFARAITQLYAEIKRLREDAWLLISDHPAPINKHLIVWGSGPQRFALLDEMGQWRNVMGRPLDKAPTHWRPLLNGPSKAEGA